MTPPLRIGLLLDDWTVDAWEAEMVRRLAASPDSEIAVVIRKADGRTGGQSAWRRLRDNHHKLAHYLYAKLDHRLFRSVRKPDAFAPVDLRADLAGVPDVVVQVKRGRHTDRVGEEGLSAIRAHAPDLLIRIGFRIIKGGLLTVAPRGIWSFHFGDPDFYRGGPPGFWEMVERAPVVGSLLQVLTDDLDNGREIARSWSTASRLSPGHALNAVAWKSAVQLPREVSRLRTLGPDAWEARLEAQARTPSLHTRPLYLEPGNLRMLGIGARLAGDLVRECLRRLTSVPDHWHLALLPGEAGLEGSLRRSLLVSPPRDRFWADPHVVEREGTFYVFLEELPYATGKGHLAVMRVQPDGSWQAPEPIMMEDQHLSYPFVFEQDGTMYLVPETSARRCVELYEEEAFPLRWRKRRTLLDGVLAADATLWRQDGRWWMFVSQSGHEGVSLNDELFLYFTDDLLEGDWTPHPLNPVCSDSRCARPAGGLFRRDDRLYRPAQWNVDGVYGKGIQLMEIIELTPERFTERPTRLLTPDWHPRGVATHTLSSVPGMLVMDLHLATPRIGPRA